MTLSPNTLLLLIGLAFTLGVEISSDYADDIPDIADEKPDISEKAIEEGVGLRSPSYRGPRPTYNPPRAAPAPPACFTVNSNRCKSRFTYHGRTFSRCTTYNSENKQPWCESELGQYEDCLPSCTNAAPTALDVIDYIDYIDYNECLQTQAKGHPVHCLTPAEGSSHQASTVSCYSDGKNYSHGKRWYVGCNTYSCNNGKVSRSYKTCYPQIKTSNCKCINPFSGFNDHHGDPAITCSRKSNPFCYVDANSSCSDKKPARGGGRYYSRVTCSNNGQAPYSYSG